MPAVYFDVTWPDGYTQTCYSPSTIIFEYFKGEQQLSLEDFMKQAEVALDHASKRVEQRYGYACSSAMDQWAKLKQYAISLNPACETTVTIQCPSTAAGETQ